MAKTVLIGLGGTGARVVEAVLMLAMAGEGPSSLSALLIDSDPADGNGERTSLALSRYQQFRATWMDGPHGVDYNAADAPSLGRIEVMPLLNSGQWLWAPPAHIQTLASLSVPVEHPLLSTLFHSSLQEVKRPIASGLQGQAHLGAAIFGTLLRDEGNPVIAALRAAMAGGAQIILAGSAFGGTGVGAAIALHRALALDTPSRGSVKAILLPPYFDYGGDMGPLFIRDRMARQAAQAEGLEIISCATLPPVPLPTQMRVGAAPCNPSMPAELVAAAQILGHALGGYASPELSTAILAQIHHAIRAAHFHYFETQGRLRVKSRLFFSNWALSLTGKYDRSTATEPLNLLMDNSRRLLEWAGSIEVMAQLMGHAPTLGWHIAPVEGAPVSTPIAISQAIKMSDFVNVTTPDVARAFDLLIDNGGAWPPYATVIQRLRRNPPIAPGHRGFGRAFVAAHHAVGMDRGNAL